MVSVGLALIVKNEADNLPRLLASIDGAFDAVALVDTGSDDNTVDIFKEWGKTQPEGFCTIVGEFGWCNDFAAARNHADELLSGAGCDWHCWADADDEIINAHVLRNVAAGAPDEVAGLVFGYDYSQHPETGSCVCHLKRERLVRRGMSNWIGRVHEAQEVRGPIQYVPDEVAHWKHNKFASTTQEVAAMHSNSRNLEILEEWVKDEPDNGRVLAYVGVENATRGEHERAIEFYRRFINTHTTWDEERAQVYRRLCASLLALDEKNIDECIRLSLEAQGVMPSWPDSWLTLAECYISKNDPARALYWANLAANAGPPDTLLIINPLEYTFHANELVAVAHAMAGQFEAAVDAGERAMQFFPDMNAAQRVMAWKSELKRERTASTYVMCAQQLVAHDEQAKALILLEQCVPYFAQDHVQVVQMRAFIRQRLVWVNDPDAFAAHYADGGDKPENWVDDEDAIAGQLPRCAFLADGIKDQINAATE